MPSPEGNLGETLEDGSIPSSGRKMLGANWETALRRKWIACSQVMESSILTEKNQEEKGWRGFSRKDQHRGSIRGQAD